MKRAYVAGLPQPGRCLVMGVLNVTPDSFSDGGEWLDPGVLPRALRLADSLSLAREDDWSTGETPTVPFVVRLDGTNDKEGRQLLADANLPNVHTEATMLGAAKKVVELAG